MDNENMDTIEKIGLRNALEADKYVDSYLMSVGINPNAPGVKDTCSKMWPDDVQRAWHTADDFWGSCSKEGFIP